MKRAIGERRRVGEGGEEGGEGLERKCGSQSLMLKSLGFGLGLGVEEGVRVWRLEKRPPRTVGRFWEGFRWP